MALEFFPHPAYDPDERLRHIESFLSLFSGRLATIATSDQSNLDTAPGGIATGLPAPPPFGGGGSGFVNGDVTGPDTNTTVSRLQGQTLTIGTPTTGDLIEWDGSAFVNTATLHGTLTLDDAVNLVVGTATGTQIGTGATQKLAFFGATPIVRPGATTDLRQALINLGLYTTGGASPLDLNGGTLTANQLTTPLFVIKATGEVDASGSAGAVGDVLTSNGAGAAATWQAGGGGSLTGAVILAPAALDRNLIQPTNDAYHAAVIKAHSPTQTADWQQWRESDDSVAMAVGPQSGYNFSAPETAFTSLRAGIFDPPVTSNANQALYARMSQSAPGGSWICAFETSDAFGNLIAGVGLDLFTAGPDFYQPDSVSVSRIVADLAPAFVDNTSAVWRGQISIRARDFGGIRTGVTIEGTGTAPAIGFLGASAVVRPSSTTDLRQALINLGLYTTGGATPLNLNGGTLTAATIIGNCTGAVTLTPGSSVRNVVSPAGDFIPLRITGSAGQVNSLLIIEDSTQTAGLEVFSDGSAQLKLKNAVTAFPGAVWTLAHNSTGTPAANFGTIFEMAAGSSTAPTQSQLKMITVWVDATHASRKARTQFYAFDTTAREALRLEASGSAAMLGVLGAAAIARPSSYTLAGTATRTLPTVAGIDNLQPGSVYARQVDLAALEGVVRQLIVDLASTSGFGFLAAS